MQFCKVCQHNGNLDWRKYNCFRYPINVKIKHLFGASRNLHYLKVARASRRKQTWGIGRLRLRTPHASHHTVARFTLRILPKQAVTHCLPIAVNLPDYGAMDRLVCKHSMTWNDCDGDQERETIVCLQSQTEAAIPVNDEQEWHLRRSKRARKYAERVNLEWRTKERKV